MKFTIFALAMGLASAGKPQVSISVRDGKYDGLDGLDPTISWEGSSQAGEMDVSYGIEASVRPTSDIASLPKSVWGKVTASVGNGWGVSARAETDRIDHIMDNAQFELEADQPDSQLNLRLTANTAGVKEVRATKGMEAAGGSMEIEPRYNVETSESDITIRYDHDGTNLELTASAENQELTISQQVDDDNKLSPTVNNRGDVSLAWERRISDDSRVTTTLKPNDSLNVEWQDSDWTASVNMPMDGANINGADVSIKRDVQF